MKKILNVLTALYFLYNFLFNFNEKTLIYFFYYLIFDISYFIIIDRNNKLRNDLIIHHINGLICVYSNLVLYKKKLNYGIVNFDRLFGLQELSTLVTSLKILVNDEDIKNKLNFILKIIWIPVRIIIPYFSIYYLYNYYYIDDIYFKIKIMSACAFLLLNIKWTLLFLKIIDESNHFSSLLLLTPIILMKKDLVLLNLILFTALSSLIYNIKKSRLTISLDTSLLTTLSLKFGYNLDISILLPISIIFFLIKYNIRQSELHSFVLIMTFVKKYSLYPSLYYLNLINVLVGYLIRHFTRIPLIWHLNISIMIISGMYYNIPY